MKKIEQLKMQKSNILDCIKKHGSKDFINLLWEVEKAINDEYEKSAISLHH